MIGSMPHNDVAGAYAVVKHYLKDIPAWPQLPKRNFRENMYVQYSEGFPGIVRGEDRIFVDTSQDLSQSLENLYTAYLENTPEKYSISFDYAAGFYACLADVIYKLKVVKGQVTGPVSWGLTITDNNGRSIIYDEVLADAAAKLLRLKAAWQEKELKKIARETVIFLDEPYMTSFGSAFVTVSKDKVVSLINETLGGINGIKGVHCCGNTDWSVILATNTDILSFDTYNYAQSLTLYPVEVRKFLKRKGTIAWGIIPNNIDILNKESVISLKDRLEEAMAPFTRDGFAFRQLLRQSLLTPSCGLDPLTEEEVAYALETLVELSTYIRKKYL
jgi:methionine synthase II (cobalamin-independent)